MRLGQLARKLSLRPSEIVSFLAENEMVIEDGSNTRLEDEQVALVMEKYAPSGLEEFVAEQEEEVVAQADLSKSPELVEGKLDQASAEVPSFQNTVVMTEIKEERIEVIKAAKVELPGLKVLGKIEFPEPKKKDVPPVEVIVADESAMTDESKKPRPESRKWTPS